MQSELASESGNDPSDSDPDWRVNPSHWPWRPAEIETDNENLKAIFANFKFGVQSVGFQVVHWLSIKLDLGVSPRVYLKHDLHRQLEPGRAPCPAALA